MIKKQLKILCVLNSTDDRMKVLDIIEECQSEARKTPKESAPAVGKLLVATLDYSSFICFLVCSIIS